MMNRLKRILIVISILLLMLIVVWFVVRIPATDAPPRPSNIPKGAFWRGAEYEGFWILFSGTDRDKKYYRFKVFSDYDGKLVMDANFAIPNTCKIELSMNDKIVEKVRYYEFDKIVLDSCMLQVVYPAFGGSFWEMGKARLRNTK